MRSASAAESVAGAGAAPSRASDELTYQTAPSRTPTDSMPSTAAGRPPKRWRNRTAAPSPIGATVSSSRASAPLSVRPEQVAVAVTNARAPTTGSAGRPAASGLPAAPSSAAVPSAFQRALIPARGRAIALARVGWTRPVRASLVLGDAWSPGGWRSAALAWSGRPVTRRRRSARRASAPPR